LPTRQNKQQRRLRKMTHDWVDRGWGFHKEWQAEDFATTLGGVTPMRENGPELGDIRIDRVVQFGRIEYIVRRFE